MPVEKLLEVASGRVWSGIEAQERGLVDVLGGLDVAVDIAAKSAGLDSSDYMKMYFPEQKPFFEQLMNDLNKNAKILVNKYTYGEMSPYVEDLKYVMENKGIQTRMPFDLEIK